MDFTPSPEVATLRERVLDFLDENFFPVEQEIKRRSTRRSAPESPTRRT